jgi:hypothetical protein
LGRAFGSRPNARGVKCKWVARKLLNGKAFPEERIQVQLALS